MSTTTFLPRTQKTLNVERSSLSLGVVLALARYVYKNHPAKMKLIQRTRLLLEFGSVPEPRGWL